MTAHLHQASVELLRQLIQTPSFSGSEGGTADILVAFLDDCGIPCTRLNNNILARNAHWKEGLPVLALNSHHDTVQPGDGWTRDPYLPFEQDGKLFGLGSNDAGGSLVALIAAFRQLYTRRDLPWNLLLLATAEEENSGPHGVSLVLKDQYVDFAMVGEPTGMRAAIAEKGLIVIDGLATGESGHAARPNGDNAIDNAMRDIQSLLGVNFDRVSDVLGPVVHSVTQIQGGHQHNVIPDRCSFVIDVRVNELYSLEEVVSRLQDACDSKLTPRSLRNRPSGIARDHPAVQVVLNLGLETFGSATLSDQVHFACPSLKIGCGESSRSHQADEYIALDEIKSGIGTYIRLLDALATSSLPKFLHQSVAQ